MINEHFSITDPDGVEIFVYKWLPASGVKKKAIIQLAHGMMEHAGRYERLAHSLNAAGYIVYANDHRGHGRTAKSLKNLGVLGEDGFNRMMEDLYQLTKRIKEEYPGLPVIFYGHSMGSFLAQLYITRYGKELNGLILSGTQGRKGIMLRIAIYLAKREIKKHGPAAPSKFLHELTFKDYNKSFSPPRTDYDWLSRDPAEVDKYINDPYCGQIAGAGFFYDLFRGIKEMHRKKNMQKIPSDLKMFIFWGEKDPVGNEGKSILNLIKEYQRLGLNNVTYKCYINGRHEIHNETNRQEVTSDVINWLDTNFA